MSRFIVMTENNERHAFDVTGHTSVDEVVLQCAARVTGDQKILWIERARLLGPAYTTGPNRDEEPRDVYSGEPLEL